MQHLSKISGTNGLRKLGSCVIIIIIFCEGKVSYHCISFQRGREDHAIPFHKLRCCILDDYLGGWPNP